LQAAGYGVTAAASAREALALLERDPAFGAIVSDIEMPEMDGLEFAEAVRGNSRTAEIPLIALSSHVASALVGPVRAAGFDCFVAKFDRPSLISAIKESMLKLEAAA
jgi:two-component system chemotaxis sensor kinase CheA